MSLTNHTELLLDLAVRTSHMKLSFSAPLCSQSQRRSKGKRPRGWPHGRVVKFARSAAGGRVFRQFESWARTWHCSSDHAEAASHMPQLEEPTTKNAQLCTGGLWGEKGKNKKIFKKKNSGKKDYGPIEKWEKYQNRQRSEERRVGKECRSRWSQYH